MRPLRECECGKTYMDGERCECQPAPMKTKSFIYDLGDTRTAIVLTELKGGGPDNEPYLLVADGYTEDGVPQEFYRYYYFERGDALQAFNFMVQAQARGIVTALEL